MRDIWGDEFVEEIAPGAFDEYINERSTVGLWCHRTDQILGNSKSGTLRLFQEQNQLRFELDLPKNSAGDDAAELLQRRDVDGVSFGFRSTKDKWARFERDGNKLYKRTVLNATLPEISLTPFAAYPENEVSVRSLDEHREEEKRASLEYKKRILALELELM
jgi:HK97 family phage prohead protease